MAAVRQGRQNALPEKAKCYSGTSISFPLLFDSSHNASLTQPLWRF